MAENSVSTKRKHEDEEDAPQTPDDSLFLPSEQDVGVTDTKRDDTEDLKDNKDSVIDSDDDSDDDDIKDYSEKEERLPQCAAFDQRLKALVETNASKVEKLHAFLQRYSSSSEAVANMVANAKSCTKLPEHARLRVALVGDSGMGKSSLINSVIDVPKLAQAGSSGESVTTVPTLYTHELPRQTTRYAAEVLYRDAAKCNELLTESLDDYNYCQFREKGEVSSEEEKMYLDRAKTALQIFRTLFCDKAEFSSEEAAKKYLENNKPVEVWKEKKVDNKVIKRMEEWCEQLVDDLEDKDGSSYVSRETDDVSELKDFINPLTMVKHGYECPRLWPLVEVVRIGVRSSTVLKHVDLMDLPGLTDTNKLRLRSANDNIKKCQALWLVADAPRASSQDNLDNTISRFAKVFPGRLAVIITKIDVDLDSETADLLGTQGENLHEYYKHVATWKRLDQEIEGKSNGRRPKKTRKQKAPAVDLEDLKSQKADAKNAAEASLLYVRNDFTVRRMKQDKQHLMPPGDILPVYCVSNRVYKQLINRSRYDVPLWDPEISGIPALRAYALTLAADAVWAAAEEYLMAKVQGLFAGIDLWAATDTSPSNRNDNLINTITRCQQSWTGDDKAIVESLSLVHGGSLMQRVRDQLPDAREHALKYLEDLSAYHHSSFLAFFRNNGTGRTKARAFDCWNANFMNHLVQNLETRWNRMLREQNQVLKEAQTQALCDLEKLPNLLKADPDHVALDMGTFEMMVQTRIAGVDFAFTRCRQKLNEKVAFIRDAATVDANGHYFTEAMLPCYEEGKKDKGEGTVQRRMNLLRRYLTDEDVLGQTAGLVEQKLLASAEVYNTNIRKGLQEALASIKTTFQGILDRAKGESLKDAGVRSQIKDFVKESMPEIIKVKDQLNQIKQGYQDPKYVATKIESREK